MEKITVTIRICVQIGEQDWTMKNHSKIFDKSATITQIELWLKTYDNKYNIMDAIISMLDE